MDTLGSRIARQRKKKNMSQTEFADHFKIGRSTVAMWETDDRKPDSDMLKRISDFFDVSLDYLISGSEHSMDEKMKEAMSDPYAVLMFSDFPTASEEDKKMLLEIWNSIKNRNQNK